MRCLVCLLFPYFSVHPWLPRYCILQKWVFSTQYTFSEYHKVQAREASSVGYCIDKFDVWSVQESFTSVGLHPCSLDVTLLCYPIRIPRIERYHNSVPRLHLCTWNARENSHSVQLIVSADKCDHNNPPERDPESELITVAGAFRLYVKAYDSPLCAVTTVITQMKTHTRWQITHPNFSMEIWLSLHGLTAKRTPTKMHPSFNTETGQNGSCSWVITV